VAHACNPSYSGGRGQEDCGSKPAWQILCETRKNPPQEKAGGVAQGVGPEFRPQNYKKKKKKSLKDQNFPSFPDKNKKSLSNLRLQRISFSLFFFFFL
jgi:hypothetical protein